MDEVARRRSHGISKVGSNSTFATPTQIDLKLSKNDLLSQFLKTDIGAYAAKAHFVRTAVIKLRPFKRPVL